MNSDLLLEAMRELKLEPGVSSVRTVRKVDSLKNQSELLKAIRNKSYENIQKLLDLGVDPNYIQPGIEMSPLALATSMSDLESMTMLLEAGARENLIEKKDSNSSYSNNAFYSSLSKEDDESLLVLYQYHGYTALLSNELKSYSRPKILKALLETDYFGHTPGEYQRIFEHLLTGVNRWRVGSYLDVITKFYTKFEDLRSTHADSLWRIGIIHDKWNFCQNLAKNGIAPKSWSLPIKELMHYNGNKTQPNSLMVKSVNPRGSYDQYELTKNACLKKIDPIGLALQSNSVSCLEAFLKIEPFKEMFLKSVLSKDFAVYADFNCLNLLKKSGVIGLEELSDSVSGDNPLHIMFCKNYELSKQKVQNGIQLCQEWAVQRNAEGKLPIELLEKNYRVNVKEYEALLDEKVIKKQIGRTGTKRPSNKVGGRL